MEGTERSRPTPTLVGRGVGNESIDASAPPPTAPAEPAAEALSPAETLWEELLEGRLPQDWRSPIDQLVVHVLRDGEPVEEGRGLLWRGAIGRGLRDAPLDREPDAETQVDRDGTFAFLDLKPGGYWIGVELPGEAPRIRFRAIDARHGRNWHVVFLLGTGGIHGTVFDETGRVAAGADVGLSANLGIGSGWRRVRTDRDGTYRLDGLIGGTYWVSHGERRERVDLKRAAEVRVDFGYSEGTPLRTIVVRTAAGLPIPGPHRVIFAVEEKGESYQATTDVGGRVTLPLPPGAYQVVLRLDQGWKSVGPDVRVNEADREVVVVVPGARVHGEIAGLKPRADGSYLKLQIWWRPEGETENNAVFVMSRSDAPAYVLDGIEPGFYRIVGHPLRLVNRQGNMPVFAVREGDTDVQLDLEARVPR